MLNLPIYLLGSCYYLHTRIGGKQIKRSLGTSYKRVATLPKVCRPRSNLAPEVTAATKHLQSYRTLSQDAAGHFVNGVPVSDSTGCAIPSGAKTLNGSKRAFGCDAFAADIFAYEVHHRSK